MGAFVYMLRCADRSYYVGCATGEDLVRRVAQHNDGNYGGYTSSRRPVELVWSQYFDRVTDEFSRKTDQRLGTLQERSADTLGLGFGVGAGETARRSPQVADPKSAIPRCERKRARMPARGSPHRDSPRHLGPSSFEARLRRAPQDDGIRLVTAAYVTSPPSRCRPSARRWRPGGCTCRSGTRARGRCATALS